MGQAQADQHGEQQGELDRRHDDQGDDDDDADFPQAALVEHGGAGEQAGLVAVADGAHVQEGQLQGDDEQQHRGDGAGERAGQAVLAAVAQGGAAARAGGDLAGGELGQALEEAAILALPLMGQDVRLRQATGRERHAGFEGLGWRGYSDRRGWCCRHRPCRSRGWPGSRLLSGMVPFVMG